MAAAGRMAAVVVTGLVLTGVAFMVATTPTVPSEQMFGQGVFVGKTMGTTWMVRVAPGVGNDGPAVQDAVQRTLDEIEAAMSTWKADSELSQVRRTDGPVRVSTATAGVVDAALALHAQTGGAYDPTVQPLVEFWGLHGEPRTTWPTDEDVAAQRARLGADKVEVRWTPEGPTVFAAGTALDLSSIAKGYAVDRVGHVLSSMGIANWFVEVGGEVRTSGAPSDERGWRIAIDAPYELDRNGPAALLDVTGVAVATSGNYRNTYDIDGRTVHHTLDPRTGYPAEPSVLSATVIAPDCQTADGWATALMVLGPDAGMALIEARPELEAWLVVPDDGGAVTVGSSGTKRLKLTSLLDGERPPE